MTATVAPTSLDAISSSIPIPMDPFPEPPWRTPNTLGISCIMSHPFIHPSIGSYTCSFLQEIAFVRLTSHMHIICIFHNTEVRTVTSTRFARFEIHKVKTENGLIINDWLWTDERSHVNILVHLKDENKYLVFKQHKYGLDREYFALIGGLFNEGETDGKAVAKRELLEETGLEAEELIDLGKYRVQVNRGGGILFAYYAKNCFKSSIKFEKDNDYEKQDHIKLTRDELIDVTLSGEVGEAQWVATAALALLYEEHKEDHEDHKQTDGLKISKSIDSNQRKSER